MTAIWISICALSIMAVICAAEYGVHRLNEYIRVSDKERYKRNAQRALDEINKHLM